MGKKEMIDGLVNGRKTNREKTFKEIKPYVTERQYLALKLRFISEWSYEDIGIYMGINRQSAWNLIWRGLDRLRKQKNFLSRLPYFPPLSRS